MTQTRKIDTNLINDMFAVELIKMKKYNIQFIGYQKQNELNSLGEIKCISWINTTSKQRGESKGSDKSYSFSIPDYNNQTGKRVVILAESPIDALSVASMENERRGDYYLTYKIALCGTSQKNIEQRIATLKPNQIKLALDNDPPGQKASSLLKQKLKTIAPVEIIKYKGKDPNDLLINLKSK